jgi:cob(I)alamin adenosyltransferase
VVRLATRATPHVDAMLARIQNDLFDVGADLSVPGKDGDRLRLTDVPVARLEAEVATMNATLGKLTSFVLPGGSVGAAQAHMARTIVRRAERDVVRLAVEDAVTPALLRYLNRLSDHLFVLARVLNGNGADDVMWTPGANLGPPDAP